MDGFVGLEAEVVRDMLTSRGSIRGLLLQYCDDKSHTGAVSDIVVAVRSPNVDLRTKAVSQG